MGLSILQHAASATPWTCLSIAACAAPDLSVLLVRSTAQHQLVMSIDMGKTTLMYGEIILTVLFFSA
jgi:hypothetical protein